VSPSAEPARTKAFWNPAWTGPAKRGAGFVALAAALALANAANLMRPVDDGLAELRFRLLARPPSQTLTTVEIDAGSLRAAGRWPWGRERFARAIDNLEAAGARTVAFDVDFSAAASPEADKALAEAIGRRPGSVVLPTFVQRTTAMSDGGQMVESSPLGALSAEALLASVNVPVDDDGRVRRYAYGFADSAAPRQSIAALLAGQPAGHSGEFLIDYGVRAKDLPRLSFEDVYEGRFDPKLVAGRQVLIGATALELGDEFATPRHGTLSGVFVHALAYESLRQGRALTQLSPLAALALALLAAGLTRPRRGPVDLKRLLQRHFALAAGAVALPLWLQAVAPVSAQTGLVLLAQAITLAWTVRAELARRAAQIVHEREASLLHLAMHEPETQLPNRRALTAEIAGRIGGGEPGELAVIAVGVDRYPVMRALIGYGRANQVMRQLAERLATTTGETHIAHLSTSVLGLALSAETPEALGERLRALEQMDPSFRVETHAVDAFVRLGVARRGPDGDTAEMLLENASVALDEARKRDRRAVAFDPAVFVDPAMNLALMSEMRDGLKAGELALHYQPKLDLASGEVTSVEALVRWKHAARGWVAPDAFIPVAEETGNIRALTDWALEAALADQITLREAGLAVNVALNVSAKLLEDRDFRERVMRRVGWAASDLTFEITETAVVQNPQAAMAAIDAWRDAGIGIAIDDYGAGLSSLAYLKMIEADELKLDKSLIDLLDRKERDRLILKSTVDLAHSLGLKVTAEGVESEAVRRELAALGCDLVQGYLIAPALPLGDLLRFLTSAGRPPLKRRPAA
jgi:EAL domain-containing protein (putative c-di-GMP-specific phosphodiesterase class I)/CHASE2 domain-containing sensor protein/GGDEF domain-containing protein